MESASQTVLLLVNPNDITERENLTHNMREKKHVVDVLVHCSDLPLPTIPSSDFSLYALSINL